MAFAQTIEIATRGRGTTEISDEVARIVRASGIGTGLVNVFVTHTSCSLILTENADPTVRRDLETLAMGYQGVEKAYAIQAGRELRVIVESDKVTDQDSDKLSFEIAQKIPFFS